MDSIDLAQQSRADDLEVLAANLRDARAPRCEPAISGAASVDGPSARFGRSLAVVIGIDTYGEGISPLRSAVADARAVAEALRRDHGFESWCLFDGDAQLPQLLALLREQLPGALGPDDRLLFYFAGHGIALDGEAGPAGYLIPAGACRAERDGFLPMDVLHGELVRLPVRHALIILDCCFAGTFRWSSLRDVEPVVAKIYRERYDRYVESAAWQVLTSASSDQLALDMLANDRGEGAGSHSPFALALLDGLAGAADYTKDHLITVDELAFYVRERVALVAESVGRRQVPLLFPLDRHDCGQFVFQVPDRVLDLASAPVLDERANPYRGLQAFHEEDRALFFGRDTVIRRLVEAVSARQLTVVVGPSGSGKSSLVHAGLVPALREQGWDVLPTQRPGREPLAALDVWTRALGAEPTPRDLVASWIAAVAARGSARPDQPWLIILDQFEELLTHRTTASDRIAFLDALADALRAAPLLRLVVTVRSDAEPQLHDSALEPWWTAARFAVPAMTRDELRQIIERPATAAVLHFEPSLLVERLLDDVALVPAPLPLLSFALSELYRRSWTRWQGGARDRGLLETDYDEMGSVARALTQRATALHDDLVVEDAMYAITIRNIVTRMVAIIGGEVARRRVPRGELVYEDPAENRRVDDVLQRFHEARLISLGTEESGDGVPSVYAEPTHDELVRGWTKVSQWLDELDATAGTRALLAALGDAVRSWSAHRRSDSYLWSDPRVDLLSSLKRAHRFMFSADEARFLERSALRRRKLRRRLIGGLLAVITILSFTTGIALWERRNASEQAERASQSADRAQKETERANLNADKAAQETARANQKAAEALREAARANQNAVRAETEFARAAQNAARAEQEATRANQNAVRAETETARAAQNAASAEREAIEANRQRDESTRLLRQSHKESGRRLLLEGRPQEAMAYLMAARQSGDQAESLRMLISMAARSLPIIPPLQHQAPVWGAAFSSNGARVVTASLDGTARVWDAATGEPVGAVFRHRAPVTGAALSPDGSRVVTASDDKTARIWDVTTGSPLSAPLQHQGPVTSVAFSSDGSRVVTASADQTARIWDAATGKALAAPLQHQDYVRSAVFSPDGSRVVTASDDQTARVWDTATGRFIARLRHQAPVWSAAFSPDGSRVITASCDDTARIWDAATGRPLGAPLQHQDHVRSAVFSPDGARVVTASYDKTARIWDAATGRLRGAPLQHQDYVRSAVFSPDGARVVTASYDHTARVWSAATGELLAAPLQHQATVWSAAFSPDGARIVTASVDKSARVWSVHLGRPLATPLRHEAAVRSVAFSPDGSRIVTASVDMAARVWDGVTGRPLSAALQHQGTVMSAVFSSDGSRVVTASDDHTARVWDVATGRPLGGPLRHQGTVTSAVFSPDGACIVTASDDHTARVWSAVTGKPLTAPLQHESTVWSAAFSPDGSRVVTASEDKTARLWDVATGEPLAALLQHQAKVVSAVFSPDGARVVTASEDHTARVWEVATGRPLTPPLQHQAPVRSAVFSPDGFYVVTASVDKTARVWDAVTAKPLAAPLLHRDTVISAAFSPDGSRVITASADHAARVWDAATGKLLAAPLQHQGPVTSAAFSPDGSRVVTASFDKTARIWETSLDETARDGWAALAARSPFTLNDGALETARVSPALK